MYGFPLTIYLLSGWLARRNPGVDLFSHESGHLWETFFGFKGDPHLNPIHVVSNILIFGGFILLAAAWRVLYSAQRTRTLATTGPYARIRHPQYVGFIVIMIGFLLQWPTLITLVMFPILVAMYVRLARREEREALVQFGEAYVRYAAVTPAFTISHLSTVPSPRRRALSPPSPQTIVSPGCEGLKHGPRALQGLPTDSASTTSAQSEGSPKRPCNLSTIPAFLKNPTNQKDSTRRAGLCSTMDLHPGCSVSC